MARRAGVAGPGIEQALVAGEHVGVSAELAVLAPLGHRLAHLGEQGLRLREVKARSAHQFEKPASHKGEEFLYVLSGEVAFVSGSYDEIRLAPGDSLYFDSRLTHLCYTRSDTDASLLWVWCETG